MKKIKFKQNNHVKSLALAISYFVLVYLAYKTFDFNWNKNIDLLNSIGPKEAGMLVGAILLLPFFYLLKIVSPQICITVGSGYFIVEENKKDKLKIPLTELGKSEINITNLNTIDIYYKNGKKICSFQPNGSENIIYEIANEINKNLNYQLEKGETIYFGKKFQTYLYCYHQK